MLQIGIRELRVGLSRALRRVRTGETIEVTDRGRPIARIVPVAPSIEGLEHLIREGRVRPPSTTEPIAEPLDLPSTMTSEEAIDALR
jgi:prevent-host-death family protein